ncbi:UNVERIFIED_CONTAM: hypothetical protein HDU68_009443 [Siphonaria sp. JEL0065]|nr:hypothetical protein HDU68_009443 [Siphonaria sp. JEL0065]
MKVFVGFGATMKPVSKAAALALVQKVVSVSADDVFFNENKNCAFVNVAVDDAAKLKKTLNGSKWLGAVLRVEDAMPDYRERLALCASTSSVPTTATTPTTTINKKQVRRLKRLIRSKQIVVDPKIGTPVNDVNWKERKDTGWKLFLKYKRAVLVVKSKLKRDAKKPTKIDPTKYPTKITKLYPRSTIPDPSVTQLEWPGIEHQPRKPTIKKPRMMHMSDDDSETERGPLTSKLASSATSTLTTTTSQTPTTTTTRQPTINEIMPPRSSKKWMPSFLSDDEDESDTDDKEKEGDKEDLLKPEELIIPEDLTDERESSMSILRGMLGMAAPTEESRAMYAPVFWKNVARFDPDADDAQDFLRSDEDEDRVGDDDALGANDALDEDNNNNMDVVDTTTEKEEIPSGIVDSTVQGGSYVVTTNLRSLVFGDDDNNDKPSGGLFSWLGDQPADQEPSGPGMLGDSIRERVGGVIKSAEKFSLLAALGIQDNETSGDASSGIKTSGGGGVSTGGLSSVESETVTAPANFGSTSLFFFHFDHPEYASRTLFTNDKTFMRHDTIEAITKEWEDNKLHVTQDFKKKHKSATRRRTRMVRSSGKGGGGAKPVAA